MTTWAHIGEMGQVVIHLILGYTSRNSKKNMNIEFSGFH